MLKNEGAPIEGFWLSYIDIITVLASIFFILFAFAFYSLNAIDKRISNRKMAEFTKAWEAAENKLKSLGADPVIDMQEGGWMINIAEKILFDYDSSNIKPDGETQIDSIGVILNEFITSVNVGNSMRIIVGGHADTNGTENHNLPLSDKRSQNVRERLKKLIPFIYIDAVGYGERKPKPGKEGDKESRRVTIVIQPISVHLLKPEVTAP